VAAAADFLTLPLLFASRPIFLIGTLPIDGWEGNLYGRKEIRLVQSLERHVLVGLLKFHFLNELICLREHAIKLETEPSARVLFGRLLGQQQSGKSRRADSLQREAHNI
jgi:hypothetical protein